MTDIASAPTSELDRDLSELRVWAATGLIKRAIPVNVPLEGVQP